MLIRVTCKCGKEVSGLFFRRTISDEWVKRKSEELAAVLASECLTCCVQEQRDRRNKKQVKGVSNEVPG